MVGFVIETVEFDAVGLASVTIAAHKEIDKFIHIDIGVVSVGIASGAAESGAFGENGLLESW